MQSSFGDIINPELDCALFLTCTLDDFDNIFIIRICPGCVSYNGNSVSEKGYGLFRFYDIITTEAMFLHQSFPQDIGSPMVGW